jgi:HD-GYP domain-containing protein (c-di-GMP phosphodiesterase class II)
MRQFPLRIHLITLTTCLVVAVGGSIGWLSHVRATQILHESTEELALAVTRELGRELALREDKVRAVMRVLANDKAIMAPDLASRLPFIPAMADALATASSVISVFVGYGDGDYLLLRRVESAVDREIFDAPANARFVVQSIDRGPDDARSLYLYLDDRLAEIARRERPQALAFDPRERPWYTAATAARGLITTPPYEFFTSKLVGYSQALVVSGDPIRRTVLAADIRLDDISEVLQRIRPTPSTRLALFDSVRQPIAADDGRDTIAAVSALLDGPALSAREITDGEGKVWVGRVMPVVENGRTIWLLGALIPESEILGDARRLLREQGLLIAVLLALGLVGGALYASRLSGSLRQLAGTARAIQTMDFSPAPVPRSIISEVDELSLSIDTMRGTIGRFQEITRRLAEEQDLEHLIAQVLRDAAAITGASAAILYLRKEGRLRTEAAMSGGDFLADDVLAPLDGLRGEFGVDLAVSERRVVTRTVAVAGQAPLPLPTDSSCATHALAVPLRTRAGTTVGALVMARAKPYEEARVNFVERLSGFVSVSLETRDLIGAQKALFDAFVRLIAGAIDAKSPYTGGHCERVPRLAFMLAEAACAAREGPYADFNLDARQWEALHLAAWLHDCGKVTTPEFVVDKATRLETLYDRIHEVRTRFELLKREAEARCWQRIADGADRDAELAGLEETWRALDEDFAFVAECNSGETFISDERRTRLAQIAARTWTRTLDDRLGLGPEEAERKARVPPRPLPVREPLLADRVEHRIAHPRPIRYPDELCITLAVPELLYDRGELHNLLVPRGTLTAEERFKINEHIIQTLLMLEELPFPEHLAEVPEFAGGHHERMDGKGYPRGLKASDMSPVARMLALADVYEALTAGDRPYKPAKTPEQALGIMGSMAEQGHLDRELFELFRAADIPARYAQTG